MHQMIKGTFPTEKFKELSTPFYFYDTNLLKETLTTLCNETKKHAIKPVREYWRAHRYICSNQHEWTHCEKSTGEVLVSTKLQSLHRDHWL